MTELKPYRSVWYEPDPQTGKLRRRWSHDGLPSGRFRTIDGKSVRIGDPIGASYVGRSDDLGTQGILNPADGKMYDSRSQYTRAVKAAGCEIVGNDMKMPTKPREIRGNFNVRKDLKKAVQKVLHKA